MIYAFEKFIYIFSTFICVCVCVHTCRNVLDSWTEKLKRRRSSWLKTRFNCFINNYVHGIVFISLFLASCHLVFNLNWVIAFLVPCPVQIIGTGLCLMDHQLLCPVNSLAKYRGCVTLQPSLWVYICPRLVLYSSEFKAAGL